MGVFSIRCNILITVTCLGSILTGDFYALTVPIPLLVVDHCENARPDNT